MDTMDKIMAVPDMPELTFDDGPHIYRLNGVEIPSVSAIMTPLRDATYKGINGKTLERAADKGTSVHNSIENWIKYSIEDVPEEHEGYFEAFRKWWELRKPIVVGSEVRIYHRLMQYAGTGDFVGYIDGELNLVDYKSTYAISDMTCGIQLEGYSQAFASHGIRIQKKRILHLKKDGSFDDSHEYPASDAARWRVFGALKSVYDYIGSYK